MRRLVPFLSVPVLATMVSLAVAACASESEGYPCSPLNNNDDCDDGLRCITPPNSSATNAPDVCCPVQGVAPTTPECTVNGGVDAGNSAPPDGSTFPEASTETSIEAPSGDAPQEATTSDSATEASTSDTGPG